MMMERYPNLKEEVGSLNPSCEVSSLLDGKLVRLSIASCALVLVYQPSVSFFFNIYIYNKDSKEEGWGGEG